MGATRRKGGTIKPTTTMKTIKTMETIKPIKTKIVKTTKTTKTIETIKTRKTGLKPLSARSLPNRTWKKCPHSPSPKTSFSSPYRKIHGRLFKANATTSIGTKANQSGFAKQY